MGTAYEETRIRGKTTLVPAVRIAGATTIVLGRWVRVAQLKDEELIEGDVVEDPRTFIALLKQSGLPADVFTFAERPPPVQQVSRVSPSASTQAQWSPGTRMPEAAPPWPLPLPRPAGLCKHHLYFRRCARASCSRPQRRLGRRN
jgi:hypothetical protein